VGCFSILSILSYNVLAEYDIAGRNFNDTMDFFSNQVLLPLGGLFIAVFAGWAMRREDTRDELTSLTAGNFAFWHFLIRFVVPPALLVIFVQGIRG
jgi:NSS family neurotransmitter:Na+ symporter